jgi:hypothetical protein
VPGLWGWLHTQQFSFWILLGLTLEIPPHTGDDSRALGATGGPFDIVLSQRGILKRPCRGENGKHVFGFRATGVVVRHRLPTIR